MKIMKLYKNKILILLAFVTTLVSCYDDEIVQMDPTASTTLSMSTTDLVLEKDNAGQDVLTVNWTEPQYGFSAATNFQILIDLADNNFATAQTISAEGDLSKTFENEEFNKILLGLGVEPGTATSLQMKVNASLSPRSSLESNVSDFTATAYADKLDLTTPWGLVGSATVNGWDGPDMPFYKSTEIPSLNVAYVTLTDGEFKIRKDNDWALNYGSDANDGNLQEGGANIPIEAGTYKITFDENALTYTVESYTWGLVGSATVNGWDGPDMQLEYDATTDTWRADVKLESGEFKFRLNNDWSVNYGDTGLDGVLDAGGDNIPITAGYYAVQLNLNDFTYIIEKTNVYGIVGSGYNDWGGAGPDAAFKPDYSQEGVYYIHGVTLLDGEIKFRVNNDWGINYGDTGLDGTLEEGGDNIPSTAGVYDVVLDFSNPNAPTYSMTAK